jgi:hypothetical protein
MVISTCAKQDLCLGESLSSIPSCGEPGEVVESHFFNKLLSLVPRLEGGTILSWYTRFHHRYTHFH